MTVARPTAPLTAPSTAVFADHTSDFEFDRRGLRPVNPRVSVIVPAKDEADNIREILPYLSAYDEVIVVVGRDDEESMDAALTTLPSAKVVHQTRKGKGNAMVCGFKEATGDVIVTFDVDGSADPHEIPRFVRALTAGADLAKGSRFCPGGGSQDITQFRAIGNNGLNLLATGLVSTRFTDLCYGFNAFWADQLPLLDLPEPDAEGAQVGDGFEIEAMIIGRFALSKAVIFEVPSYEHYRYHGHTNLNAIRDGFRVLWTLLRDRLHRRHYRALAGRLHPFGHSERRPNWMLHHPRTRVLQATSCPEFPEDIRRTLDVAWGDHDEVPEFVRLDMAIAAVEVGNNILEHAGVGRDLRIRMEVRVLGGEARVDFTDDGLPAAMDLAAVRMPDPFAESGRGLALAQALLSDLSYSRDNEGRNRWTLVSQRFG